MKFTGYLNLEVIGKTKSGWTITYKNQPMLVSEDIIQFYANTIEEILSKIVYNEYKEIHITKE